VGDVTVVGPLEVVVLGVVARLQQGLRTGHVRATDVLPRPGEGAGRPRLPP